MCACHLQYKNACHWEAHIWDSAAEGGSGRQLHLGSFLSVQQAAKYVHSPLSCPQHHSAATEGDQSQPRTVYSPRARPSQRSGVCGARASTATHSSTLTRRVLCPHIRRAYDRAALLFRGPHAELNQPAEVYDNDPELTRLRQFQKKDIVMEIRKIQEDPVSTCLATTHT